jgi:hypothetical protein
MTTWYGYPIKNTKQKPKKAQKVYALMGGCIGDRYLVAIFSSMKKANEARDWLIKVDTYYKKYPEDLEIDIYELNGERLEVKGK